MEMIGARETGERYKPPTGCFWSALARVARHRCDSQSLSLKLIQSAVDASLCRRTPDLLGGSIPSVSVAVLYFV